MLFIPFRLGAATVSANLHRNTTMPPAPRELRDMYIVLECSLVDIARSFEVSNRTIRKWFNDAGVKVRSPAERARVAKPKISASLRGRKVVFTEDWKWNLSAAGLRHGAAHARGVRTTPAGYMEYTTGLHKGRSVHSVLMEARIGRALLRNEVVHHRDGDRANNADENLELMTRSALAMLCRAQQMNRGSGMCKISWKSARKIRQLSISEGLSRSQLAERFGISTKTIGQILRGESWKT